MIRSTVSTVSTVLAELRRRFEQTYDGRMTALLLFGSHARGDAESESDIDVLVVLRDDVSPCHEIARTGHDVADISLQYDVVVSCVFVSQRQFEAEQSPLMLNVRREGVAV